MTASPSEQPAPLLLGGVSMRDLLASCAAADAISRPPRDPELYEPQESRQSRESRESRQAERPRDAA